MRFDVSRWLFSRRAVAWAMSIALATASHAATEGEIKMCVVVPDRSAEREFAPLLTALAATPAVRTVGALREADVALVYRGPGASAPAMREFLRSGKGLVVIAAAEEAWPGDLAFLSEILGATAKGRFADGAAMSVINLFPHPIFTGVTRFETDQPMLLFENLANDAQMIMEGTVGEATAPLAWVRKIGGARRCHIVPAGGGVFADAAYQRIVTNAIRWSAGCPIPGAETAVQRTFMPEAYPGAFAITLPNGPGVCFDPVRGGINYIWDGDFVDLRPRWTTKQGEPARIFGEIFYREKDWQPLRAAGSGEAAALRFRGYSMAGGYPEFHYEVGGREIHERLTPGEDGGLRRSFRVEAGAAPLSITLEPQADATVTLRGLQRDGNIATFASRSAGEFTIEIHRRAVAAP